MKTMLTSCVAAALVLAATGFLAVQSTDKPSARLRIAKIERGDLARTLSATGIVKLEQVEVGAQVTGMIACFGDDPANPHKSLDCGSHVRKDMVLAQIDPTIYQAQVERAEAELLKANANLSQSEARREQTEREWKRAEGLQPVNAIAKSEYDLALSNFRMAAAGVSLWNAAIQESKALLQIAKTNYAYTIIKSPCDGVIIDRRVNVGQTVMAAFNAPGLFLIAKDSRQTEVWASVDETDIGHILPGQTARFTVNACPDERFEGKVSQIRPNPSRRENAVTYTVVVSTDHIDSLLPDMTANLQFEIERHPNVLQVPSDALQRPAPMPKTVSELPATALTDVFSEQDSVDATTSKNPSSDPTTELSGKTPSTNHCLWVKNGDFVRPLVVEIGVSNGLMTEIKSNNVKEGMEVIWGEYCMKDVL